MNFEFPFLIEYREGQGNGLYASRDIDEGELIFNEVPLVWEATRPVSKLSDPNLFCFRCGSFLIVESSAAAAAIDRVEVADNVYKKSFNFCSEKCFMEENSCGFAWYSTCDAELEELAVCDPRIHPIILLKIISKM